LLQLADVPLLEAQFGANRTPRPEEGDLVVLQATAAGHVGVSNEKLPRDAIKILDLPRHETVAFRLRWHVDAPAGQPQNLPSSRGSGALLNEVTVGGMRQGHGDAKQSVKGDASMAAAVPTKDELLQVALQMLLAEAV
jgi:hypothetical protein